MRRLGRIWVLVASCLAVAAALFFGTAASASADYGSRAVYQVEISANASPGPSFWFWAELDAGGGDYQMTDCIHVGRGGPNAAAHASGDVESWSTSGGMLTITGVQIIGGAETVTIKVPLPASGYGHTNAVSLTVTSAIEPIFPVGYTFSFSGRRTQVQLAP